MPPADEVLVQLVGRRVRHAGGRGERLPAERAHEQQPEDGVFPKCASLRRTRSQVPSSVPRFGTDDRPKISPAQSTTGAQVERSRVEDIADPC